MAVSVQRRFGTVQNRRANDSSSRHKGGGEFLSPFEPPSKAEKRRMKENMHEKKQKSKGKHSRWEDDDD